MTTPQTTFDPVRFKETTREQWEAAAEAWHRWGPTLRAWLGQATETMLDMAGVGPGSRVLDVAAGAGDQTLAAARRTGPSGHVLATDSSPRILEFAAADARRHGFDRVETRALDGEDLEALGEAGFDAVISRVGLIYFPDQQRALSGMRRVLREGGRLAAMVYSTAEKNGFFSLPVSIIRRRANLPAPAPGQPGPFSLGAPGVLEAALERAGFRDVHAEVISAPLLLPSPAECVRFERESFGALHQMLSGLNEAEQAEVWREIEAALAEFETPEGFAGPCEVVVAAGVR